MTVDAWLAAAAADARSRGLAPVAAALEGVARGTAALRRGDWNDDLAGPERGGDEVRPPATPHGR